MNYEWGRKSYESYDALLIDIVYRFLSGNGRMSDKEVMEYLAECDDVQLIKEMRQNDFDTWEPDGEGTRVVRLPDDELLYALGLVRGALENNPAWRPRS